MSSVRVGNIPRFIEIYFAVTHTIRYNAIQCSTNTIRDTGHETRADGNEQDLIQHKTQLVEKKRNETQLQL